MIQYNIQWIDKIRYDMIQWYIENEHCVEKIK
jgi:hypothetical protein